jgi:hypothetical protein
MLQKEGREKGFFPFSATEESALKLFATKGKDAEVGGRAVRVMRTQMDNVMSSLLGLSWWRGSS